MQDKYMHLNMRNCSWSLILEPSVRLVLSVNKNCRIWLLMIGYPEALKLIFDISAFLGIVL